jgi:hypothetical protein
MSTFFIVEYWARVLFLSKAKSKVKNSIISKLNVKLSRLMKLKQL